jgi:hypothetical protein
LARRGRPFTAPVFRRIRLDGKLSLLIVFGAGAVTVT